MPRGDWILTFSGKAVYPLDPEPSSICLEDIAHPLAMLPRFAGHIKRFYSIAQHSIHVSYLVAPRFAKWGLLHDASEALIVDVPRPLKKLPEFAPYRAAEENMMHIICGVFGLDPVQPNEVSYADNVALATEIRDLMPPSPLPWSVKLPLPDPQPLHYLSPEEAEQAFLKRFNELWSVA